MHDIGDKARAHLDQRLLGPAEGGEVRQFAVLGLIIGEKIRDVVAAPGEEGRLILGRGLGAAGTQWHGRDADPQRQKRAGEGAAVKLAVADGVDLVDDVHRRSLLSGQGQRGGAGQKAKVTEPTISPSVFKSPSAGSTLESW